MWPGGRPSRPGRRRACGRSHDARRRGTAIRDATRSVVPAIIRSPHARPGPGEPGSREHDGQSGQPPGGDARQLPRCRSRMYLPLTCHIPGRSRCRSAREFTLPGRAPQTPASAVRERGHLNRPRLAWFCREFWLRPGVMIAPGWRADASVGDWLVWCPVVARRATAESASSWPVLRRGRPSPRGWGDRDRENVRGVRLPVRRVMAVVTRQALGRRGNVPERFAVQADGDGPQPGKLPPPTPVPRRKRALAGGQISGDGRTDGQVSGTEAAGLA